MSNIIRLNKEVPNDGWIVMSNQGTDCLLDLLITAADTIEKTDSQEKLISFLKERKDINEISPGTAGFDLDEMPWQARTIKEDAEFLCRVTAAAQNEGTFQRLPYEVNADIVLPWLKQFFVLADQMKKKTGTGNSVCEDGMASQKVREYITDHSFCSEYLFKDWESFLDLLYAEGGRVSSILWWDHCPKKQLKESVGSGGYKDPDNDEFIYAETQLYKEGLETYTLDEIREYIDHERKTGFGYGSKYTSHDLIPSFYLAD